MRIIATSGSLNKLLRAQTAVKQAERKFVDPVLRQRLGPKDWACFPTQAPRGAEYGATPGRLFLNAVEDLELSSELDFADLGSGLGNVCFAAALHFQRVIGIEMDRRLCNEADRIKEGLDFPNVIFINADLLKIDLSGFQVLYIYHPFRTDFTELMFEKLRTAASGTIIIANIYETVRRGIFSPRDFRQIYPLGPGNPLAFEHEQFFTYERL